MTASFVAAQRYVELAQAALALFLTGRGRLTMDSIRALCAQMRRNENARQAQASADGEAAAGIALLITVTGSLVLLFLFAFGLEPFASPEPVAWQRPWPLRYGAAVLAVLAIALLRGALAPLIGTTNLPFTMFFFAVAFAAWFGGFRPAVLSIALSLPIGAWFFAAPTGTLRVSGRDDQVAMLMIVLVGFAVALLSRSQHSAVDRALRSEKSERAERQRFETTLAGIGDAVIATMPIKCPPAPVAANPALVIQTAILKADSALMRFHSKSRAGNIYHPNRRKIGSYFEFYNSRWARVVS
jgi:hypothetical protein